MMGLTNMAYSVKSSITFSVISVVRMFTGGPQKVN